MNEISNQNSGGKKIKHKTIYISNLDKGVILDKFLHLKLFYIIDVDEIKSHYFLHFDSNDVIKSSVLNRFIKERIEFGIKKSCYDYIVYLNKNINPELIINLTEYLNQFENINKISFLDFRNSQNENLYCLFDEVTFLPNIQKVNIIKCETLKTFKQV